MLVESEAGAGFGEDRGERRLPGLEGITPEIVTVQLDQIEGVQEHTVVIPAIANTIKGRHAALATIPGIGPIITTAMAAMVAEPSGFRSGREFAAWLDLVPRHVVSLGR